MVLGRPVHLQDDDFAPGLERRIEMPEKGIRLRDLMIHVDHEDAVEAPGRQLRVLRRAEFHADIVPVLAGDAPPERVDHLADDVLGQHPALCADAPRQAHRVIALARADIGDGHARPDAGEVHDDVGLAQAIACLFGAPPGRDGRRDRAVGAREFACVGRAIFLLRRHPVAARERGGDDGRKQQCRAQTAHQSTSSTSTFSPVTRWASAAAMNGSSAPSSTSSGAVEVTPVRRSFTS